MRDPTLPTLIQNKLKVTENASKRQLSKLTSCEKTNIRAALPKLDPGTLVLIQDPQSNLWDMIGWILSAHDSNDRSYWIKRHGKKQVIRRNRVFLRSLKSLDEDNCPNFEPTSCFDEASHRESRLRNMKSL